MFFKEKQNSMLPLCFVLYLLVCLKTHPSYQGGGSQVREGHETIHAEETEQKNDMEAQEEATDGSS